MQPFRKPNLHRDEIDAQRAPEGSGARPESGWAYGTGHSPDGLAGSGLMVSLSQVTL